MGIYINKGNEAFSNVRNSEYVDKSGLIAVINATLNTEHRFSSVTRGRRFGKSMTAEMLCAYYDPFSDSRQLFAGLEIEKEPSFEQHLNRYSVIYIDVTDFTTRYCNDNQIVSHLQNAVKAGIKSVTQEMSICDEDEWDAIAVENTDWSRLVKTIEKSEALLAATLRGDAQAVARNNYIFHREYTTGKGYADIVLLPPLSIEN